MPKPAPSLPWVECPAMHINLDRPLSERFAAVPPDAIEKGRELLRALDQEIPVTARILADAARLRTTNRFHAEVIALARRIDVPWRRIMLANLSYDLALAYIGCSTVVLPTADGPVLARNMDWWPEHALARSSYLVRCYRGGRLAFANAGWPGATGVVTGLSGLGFCLALNAVLSPEGIRRTGYPVLLHLRRVLEDAPDFDAAVRQLSEATLAAPALITVAGTRNEQRVVIERTPTRSAQRWADNGKPLVTTNDYRLLFRPETHEVAEIYQTTCRRYDALTEFFRDHAPQDPVEDAALLYVLSEPDVIQQITAQHVVIRPRTGEIRMFVPRRLIDPPGARI